MPVSPRNFWGKSDGDEWHPLEFHLLDVAAAMEALLSARSLTRRRLANALSLEDSGLRSLLVGFAVLHDIGKFTPDFQLKRPDLAPTGLTRTLGEPVRYHTDAGLALWFDTLSTTFADLIWPDSESALNEIARAVFGHHGRPLRTPGEVSVRRIFTGAGLEAANTSVNALLDVVQSERISTIPALRSKDIKKLAWHIAGLMSIADWLGSSSDRWFPFADESERGVSLEDYWLRARAQADRAVTESGLRTPSLANRVNAESLIGRTALTPMQQAAHEIAIPAAPTLFVIEDATGSGKTEAAQILAHRLMTLGRATGIFWAMPTQATANAMFERQRPVLERLYLPDGPRPSLVLAHSQRHLHGEFWRTVFQVAPPQTDAASEPLDELSGETSCAAWLVDDRRRSLLADVGSGTVDQAFLAVLPSRFNAMRLAGLCEKVLVVDEAHAYDAYMIEELSALLEFQSALGGDAVILSATLPKSTRERLARAWAGPVAGTDGGAEAYPLITSIARGGVVLHQPVESSPQSTRDIPVRFVHTLDEAFAHVEHMAATGAAVAWIRNTVDECIAAARALQERGVPALVFHARFAQGDRQSREEHVMRAFGPHSVGEQRANVVVATQVIEQSLDLDFDAMVTDYAPIDLLVQRAGRLWRHAKRFRPPGVERELVVLAPDPSDPPESWGTSPEFKPTTWVYRSIEVLWRTHAWLAKSRRICIPADARKLIESVYGDGDAPDEIRTRSSDAEARLRMERGLGMLATLKVTDGYSGDSMPWVEELEALTRLSEGRTTIRLGRLEGNSVRPWFVDEEDEMRAWALSEVRVSPRRIPPDAVWNGSARVIETARRRWGRFDEQIALVPLDTTKSPLESTLSRRGKEICLRYSSEMGLEYA